MEPHSMKPGAFYSYRTAATLMRDILDGIEALLTERPMLAAVRVGSTTLGNQRAELKARLNELQPDGPNDEQDAARYRFLRSEESEQLNGAWAEIMEAGCNGTKMDAAIDAAMKRIPATGNESTQEKNDA